MARPFNGLNLILLINYHLFAFQNIHHNKITHGVSLRVLHWAPPFSTSTSSRSLRYLTNTLILISTPKRMTSKFTLTALTLPHTVPIEFLTVFLMYSNGLIVIFLNLTLTKPNPSCFIYPFDLTPFQTISCNFTKYCYTIRQTCSNSWCTIVLSMDYQISNMHKSIHYHIYSIRSICNSILSIAIIISSSYILHLFDYCNNLLFNISAYKLNKLQTLQIQLIIVCSNYHVAPLTQYNYYSNSSIAYYSSTV